MAVVNGSNLARSFGDVDIFSGVTVSIPRRARIALVGPNGSGKTSLLRILAQVDSPSEGTISQAKGLQIGFLPQDATREITSGATLWEEMLTPFADLIREEARLEEMAERMAEDPYDADLIAAYGDAQHRFEVAGGYDYETRIQQVLGGLGFAEEDFHRPLTDFSGGQKTRALLARLLLESPGLLVLDEPTNHLDIHAIEWLEKWLNSYEGALLVVSHDRSFMDNVVNHVWELIFGRLEEYRGSYSHYVQQREERHERLLKEYRRQQEFIEKEQEYIRRNIAGQNTRQAQGRRKRLERFLRDEAITAPREHGSMSLQITAEQRSGDEVLKTRDLVVGYDEPLFSVPDIVLYRGECAALIGPNGAGKSTFLKTVLGQMDPLGGQARIGASVDLGYFAQAHEGLNPQNTILDEIMDASGMLPEAARGYLGRFLFSGDDALKRIHTLSGGERGRVALAKLALTGSNFLLLDEPTNHLDIPSQEILEDVLDDYRGTIILVSHDRYLIRELATQIWAIQPGGGEMVVFEGAYDEYVAWREGREAKRSAPQQEPQPESHSPPSEPSNDRPRLTPYQRRQRLAEVEGAIHKLEVEMVNMRGSIEAASTAGHIDEVRELGKRYEETEARLAALYEEWETLMVEEAQ